MKHTLFRILAALALLIGVVLSMVRSAQAAASPTIEVIAVKVGETVTIRAYDFPGGLFTVRMDKYGNMALNGLVADVTNTGAGGSFQETYKIPAALKNEARLAIRLENSAGYYAYDWFANQISTQPTPTPTITPVPVTNKVLISVLSVEQNKTVTLRTTNFPANTNFTVRVGPFYTFFRDYVTTGTINSGKGGTFDFSVTLPAVVKDVELVTVRLDGGGIYAYNALRNVTGSGTLTPTPSAASCQIVSIVLNGPVSANSDFDAVWTIKNTSSTDWDAASVDYQFVSGAALHKKASYDLRSTLKAGSSASFIVDMRAPATRGTYKEYWAVMQGSKTLCSMNVTMNVK